MQPETMGAVTEFQLKKRLTLNLNINDEFLKKFLSPPIIEDEYYETDKTTGLFAYVILVSAFTVFFYIPSVSKITGITYKEWLIIVFIHCLFDLLPYYAIKNFYKTKFYAFYNIILCPGLCCLLVFFSGDINSFLWFFFILYAGRMGVSPGLNIYQLLIVFIGPLFTGYFFHRYGYFHNPVTDWIRMFFFSALSSTFYIFAGSTNDNFKAQIKKNMELTKKLKMEKERQRLSREIHDGIGSSFSTSIMIVELLKKEGTIIDGNNRHLTNLKESLNDGMKELRDLLWTEGDEDISVGDFITYIKEKFHNLLKNTDINHEIKIDIKNEGEHINSMVSLNLIRIIQESITNCIKHAEAGIVHISIKEKDRGLKIKIKDNGKGFDPPMLSTKGYGLRNIKRRCDDIGARFDIISKPQQGTEIEIEMSLI